MSDNSLHFTCWGRGPRTRIWGSRGLMFLLPFSFVFEPSLAGSPPGNSLLQPLPRILSAGSRPRWQLHVSYNHFLCDLYSCQMSLWSFFPSSALPWSEIKLHINQLGFPDTLLWASSVVLCRLVEHACRSKAGLPFQNTLCSPRPRDRACLDKSARPVLVASVWFIWLWWDHIKVSCFLGV